MEQKGGKKEIRGGFVPKLRSIVPSSLAHCWAFFFFLPNDRYRRHRASVGLIAGKGILGGKE